MLMNPNFFWQIMMAELPHTFSFHKDETGISGFLKLKNQITTVVLEKWMIILLKNHQLFFFSANLQFQIVTYLQLIKWIPRNTNSSNGSQKHKLIKWIPWNTNLSNGSHETQTYQMDPKKHKLIKWIPRNTNFSHK